MFRYACFCVSVTKDYEVYPESFMSDSLVMRIKEKFQGDGSKGIILVDQHINPSVGIYLFVISNKHGLHHYLIRSSETDSDDESHAEELNDHLQKKAMSFKTSLCSKGGCTKDLGNFNNYLDRSTKLILS